MSWKEFKQDRYWLEIAQLLTDRIKLIKDDLSRADKTATLLHVRVLQQELADNVFMLSLPDKIAADSVKEEQDGELATVPE